MGMVGFQGVGIEIKRLRSVLDFALMAAAAAGGVGVGGGFHGQVVRLFLLLLMIGGVHLGS